QLIRLKIGGAGTLQLGVLVLSWGQSLEKKSGGIVDPVDRVDRPSIANLARCDKQGPVWRMIGNEHGHKSCGIAIEATTNGEEAGCLQRWERLTFIGAAVGLKRKAMVRKLPSEKLLQVLWNDCATGVALRPGSCEGGAS